MTSFPALQSRSANLVCPHCGTCAMWVILRCDTTDRQCTTVAWCDHCGRRYDAEVLPTYAERFEAARRTTRSEPCSLCGSELRSLQSLCDRIAKECFFLVSCRSCGDVRLA